MADTISNESTMAKNTVAEDLNAASEQDGKWWKHDDALNYEKDLHPQAAAEEEDKKVGGKPQSKDSNIKQQPRHVQVFLEDRDKPEAVLTDTISHGLDYVYFHSAYKNQRNPVPLPKPQRISCSFGEGSFGLKIRDKVNRGGEMYVEVESIEPGGQAEKQNKLQILDQIIQVGDTDVRGLGFTLVVESLQSAPRPVVLTFERPLNSNVLTDPFTIIDTDVLKFFVGVASNAVEPIKSKANVFLEATADQWQRRQKSELYYGKDTRLFDNVKEVLECMREIYCIEQIGRKPRGKKEFETHIREQLNDMFTNEDWYGIDPDQTNDENDKSRLNQDTGQLILSSALRLTFYSNATDINIGNYKFNHFLKLLPMCKPYREYLDIINGSMNLSNTSGEKVYQDQLELIFTLIFTLSNFGDLQLSRHLLPDEYNFLASEAVLKHAFEAATKNISCLGQLARILFCLRIFGMTEKTHPTFKHYVQQIAGMQRKDGSFVTMLLRNNKDDKNSSSITTLSELSNNFSNNAMVICALCPRVFRGFGPSIPGSLNVLRQLIVKDGRKETIVDASTGFKVSMSATGTNATTLSNQKAILNLYPKAADMKKSNSIKMPLKRKAALRLDKLLDFKRKQMAMTSSQWKKYKKAGGYENMRGLGLEKRAYFQMCKKLTGRMKSLHNFSRKLEKYHINHGGANVNAIIDSIDFDEVTVEHGGSEINLFDLFKQVGAEGGMYVDREDEWWNKQAYKLEILSGAINRGSVLRKIYERYLEGFERKIMSESVFK